MDEFDLVRTAVSRLARFSNGSIVRAIKVRCLHPGGQKVTLPLRFRGARNAWEIGTFRVPVSRASRAAE